MVSPLWTSLPDQVRGQVDAHVMKGHKLQAVKIIRDSLGGRRPELHECLEVVAERFKDLGQRFTRSPTAPLDLAALVAAIEALPHRPASIEAEWDGDSEGWMVTLMAVTIEPQAAYHLATIQHGTDIRLFNGEVPPWPKAREASVNGQALAEMLGIPFHFATPEEPELAPRPRDSPPELQQAARHR